MERTGTAEMPLHSGKAPSWLFSRMKKLASPIAKLIIEDYGRREFLKRISDPYWFQAFGCLLGFDWHSSGLTTTVCGALKEALSIEQHGVAALGGKGRTSRKTPKEIANLAEELNFNEKKTNELIKTSRLVAKIDSSCVQDSYQLYHHSFFITEEGRWAVVQQGMNSSYARRYHWINTKQDGFFNDPHNGIISQRLSRDVLNLASKSSSETRQVSLDIIKDNPEKLKNYLYKQTTLLNFSKKKLSMPRHHKLTEEELPQSVIQALKKAYQLQPENYEELVLLKGIGAKSLRALALISETIYGTKASWKDPAKYAWAHGGKDGWPYPVDKPTYDSSIKFLKEIVEATEIEKKEKKSALRRLNKLNALIN